MSISNVTETALLNLIFKGTTWANYADNATVAPETNIVVALHTADPGEAGDMTTNETTYTGYARKNVARGAGWNVAGDTATPAATIEFNAGTAGTGTVTHFSTGKSGGGAAPIIMSGATTLSMAVGAGITPKLTTATTLVLN